MGVGQPNPRGKKLEKPGGGVSRFGSPLIYVLLLLVGFLLLRSLFQDAGFQRVPYSRLIERIKSDGCQKVILNNEWVKCYGKAADGSKSAELPWLAIRVQGDPQLLQLLEQKHLEYEAAAEGGMSEMIWMLAVPIGIGLLFVSWLTRRMGGGMPGGPPGVMSFGKTKARIYMESNTGVTFKDVAGVDEAADELKEIVEFLKTPGKFRRLGGRIPKGVLLVGPPGTGKTLLARAVAGEAGVPFFSLSGSEFVEMFVGVGAARIRDLFQQAEAKAPCIVFIDELDALGKVRVQSPMGSHEEREQTLNQLLAEMDGFDARKGVIIMAATNRPEVLDPALLRPGRFDRQVLVDKPDVRGREDILRIHAKGVKMGPDVDLKIVAARTAGFAGADLANLVNEAALLAARNDKTAVGMRDFESAIDRLIAGLEKKRVMSTKERKIVAYHESGHAIVATVLPGLDPVHKISIVQRGFGALGYTMQLPLEDRYLMTRGDLLSQLAVLLAGRTAEEIALGEISTGAQNDLQRASDIARAMVTEFGMSDALGAINYDGNRRARFLDIPIAHDRGLYGEETAQQIDAEVKRILTDAHDTARRVLTEKRDKLEAVTQRLLEVEVMEGDELRQLLAVVPPPSPDDVPLPATD